MTPNTNYVLAKEIEEAMAPVAMKIVSLGFALDGDDKFRVEQARNLYYTSARIIRDVAERLREEHKDAQATR